MIEREIEIRTADGVADGFLIKPEKEGRWPGVLYLTDIGGIREANRAMARRVAAEGYTVLLPNAFYRSGRPPLFNFSFETAAARGDGRRSREMSGS